MKLFEVTPEKCYHDCYTSCIIAANSKEEIKNRIEIDSYGTRHINIPERNVPSAGIWFHRCQGKLSIEEITLDKTEVILSSFMSG